jgi:CBS domain-containing protein
MTRDVLLARADWSVGDLAAFLVQHSISGAPVVEADGRPVGVVSLTDLARDARSARATPRQLPPQPHDFYRRALEWVVGHDDAAGVRFAVDSRTTVRDLMTPAVFSVPPDTPVQEVADTLIRGRIHRVFVLEDEKIVGVISAMDMLPLIREL